MRQYSGTRNAGSMCQNFADVWTERQSVRVMLRLMVKRILRKCNYPTDRQDCAVEQLLEQANALGEARMQFSSVAILRYLRKRPLRVCRLLMGRLVPLIPRFKRGLVSTNLCRLIFA
jgi:hypothetical protein